MVRLGEQRQGRKRGRETKKEKEQGNTGHHIERSYILTPRFYTEPLRVLNYIEASKKCLAIISSVLHDFTHRRYHAVLRELYHTHF